MASPAPRTDSNEFKNGAKAALHSAYLFMAQKSDSKSLWLLVCLGLCCVGCDGCDGCEFAWLCSLAEAIANMAIKAIAANLIY